MFVLLVVADEARSVARDDARFGRYVERVGRVTDADRQIGVIDVSYRDPVTGSDVVAASVVHGAPLPAVEDRVSLEVSATDRTAVRLAGVRRTWSDLPFFAGLLVVPLSFLVLRRRHVRRLERLMGSDDPTYVMDAVVVPPTGMHRRWLLRLHALDTGVGEPPVCTLALIDRPDLPDRAFRVEVKGSPRPYGLVAARVDEHILWPRGRALGRQPRVPVRSRPGPASGVARRLLRARQPASGRKARAAQVLRLIGLVLVAGFMWRFGARSNELDDLLQASRPVHAVVVAVHDHANPPSFEIEYEVAGAPTRAVIDGASDTPEVGAVFDARYEVQRPSNAWPRDAAWPSSVDVGFEVLLLVAGSGALVAAFILSLRAAG